MIEFSINQWIGDEPLDCAEERATLCELRILVNGKNACVFVDRDCDERVECVTLPAINLAEGLACDWWRILGSRDQEYSIWPWRIGYVLPDVSFRRNGSMIEVLSRDLSYSNPNVKFSAIPDAVASRETVEGALSRFIEEVIERLEREGVEDSGIAQAWSRIRESRANPSERVFCEAAGALGLDPYAISDEDAAMIERADKLRSE